MKILGLADIPKEQVKRFFTVKYPKFANLYFIDVYYSLQKRWQIKADILIAQSCLETAYFTSWWSLTPRNNFAGIGVTGETSTSYQEGYVFNMNTGKWHKGLAFPSEVHGISAHFAHMSAYVYQQYIEEASILDKRYAIVKSVRTSIISDTVGLNNTWAMSSGYSASIERIYNSIRFA